MKNPILNFFGLVKASELNTANAALLLTAEDLAKSERETLVALSEVAALRQRLRKSQQRSKLGRALPVGVNPDGTNV